MERSRTELVREIIIKHWEIRVSVINLLPDPLSFNYIGTLSGYIDYIPKLYFIVLTDRFLFHLYVRNKM